MTTIKTWMRALRTIPRIDRTEWDNYDIISRWLVATRSAVFVMTAISAMIGGILAWKDGNVNWVFFMVALAGLIFAHASNNLINDLVDYNKGIDVNNYYRSQYGPQPLENGFLKKPVFYRYIGITLLLAIAAGIYLVMNTGPLTPVLAFLGLFFLLFYTWPLKYIGMGEPTVILVWGPLMIGGTYYVAGGSVWSWEVAMIGLVYALGPTSVLFGKHTDKLREDKAKGVNTLPVIIGEKVARYTNVGMWVSQYLLVGFMVAAGTVSPVMLVILLALPKLLWAYRVYSKPRPESAPPDLPGGVWPLYLSAHAFNYNKTFGGLFLLGLIADTILFKTGWYFVF